MAAEKPTSDPLDTTNKGRLICQKRPLTTKDIWTIRVREATLLLQDSPLSKNTGNP
jgi:hypothetical protein